MKNTVTASTVQVLHAPVETVAGAVPGWVSGTLARHACGVLGDTQHSTVPEFINRVGHLFDCIGQLTVACR